VFLESSGVQRGGSNAYANAVAESFVESFKTELIADRTWATRSQLELAVIEYVAWFNNERLHEALDDRPRKDQTTIPIKPHLR